MSDLSDAFTWWLTEEGHDYWECVNDKMNGDNLKHDFVKPEKGQMILNRDKIVVDSIDKVLTQINAYSHKDYEIVGYYYWEDVVKRLNRIRDYATNKPKVIDRDEIVQQVKEKYETSIHEGADYCDDVVRRFEEDAKERLSNYQKLIKSIKPPSTARRCTIKQSEIHGDIEMMWPKWEGYGDE